MIWVSFLPINVFERRCSVTSKYCLNGIRLISFLFCFRSIEVILMCRGVFLRNFNRSGMDFLKKVKPMLSDLNTYLTKVRENYPVEEMPEFSWFSLSKRALLYDAFVLCFPLLSAVPCNFLIMVIYVAATCVLACCYISS